MQPSNDSTDRRGFDFAEKVFVLGVLGLLVVPALRKWVGPPTRRSGQEASVEETLDKSLDDSFPASDPPATQDFDIPVNRQ